jgi:hypothetical protein
LFLFYLVQSSPNQVWKWLLHCVVIIHPWDSHFPKLLFHKSSYFYFFSKNFKTLFYFSSIFDHKTISSVIKAFHFILSNKIGDGSGTSYHLIHYIIKTQEKQRFR